jgi:hypothetical protein
MARRAGCEERLWPSRGRSLWLILGVMGLSALLIIASFLVDEPMRRSMEKEINRRLTGYSVRVPRLYFCLFDLSVTLYDVHVFQQAHPNPPVAFLPRLHASVHWRELLSGAIVSDFAFDKPRFHINLPQLRKEAADPTPMKDRGWQQAALAIYPFKINLLRINDGRAELSPPSTRATARSRPRPKAVPPFLRRPSSCRSETER